MTSLYLDESGDLSFNLAKKGCSSKFSIAFLIVENRRPVQKLVKKIFKSLPPPIKRKCGGALHAKNEKTSTIRKLLIGLATKDIRVASMCLDKRKILVSTDQNELYASIVISLINRLYADGVFDNTHEVNLVASRRNTSKSLNDRFSYDLNSSEHGMKFTVDIVKPSDDKCLQAVDFVSWALWQKYEKGDCTYSDLIADKTICEYNMYS